MLTKDSETTLDNKSKSNKTIFLIGVSIVVLIIGVFILFALQSKQKPVRNYTNPFSSQKHATTYQNPFVVPTATYQNPFTLQNQQSANKAYQNPFSGGQ